MRHRSQALSTYHADKTTGPGNEGRYLSNQSAFQILTSLLRCRGDPNRRPGTTPRFFPSVGMISRFKQGPIRRQRASRRRFLSFPTSFIGNPGVPVADNRRLPSCRIPGETRWAYPSPAPPERPEFTVGGKAIHPGVASFAIATGANPRLEQALKRLFHTSRYPTGGLYRG